MFGGVKPTAAVLYLARSVSLAEAGETVQMFPPGKQNVKPSRVDGKEPEEIELTIDAQTAADLEAIRAELQARADANEGDAPYFDFNHEDGPASGWPKRIFWGGDDPLLGGVRAETEWSSAGDEARTGKTFRRFSPAFYADGGRVTGCPVNMGGLVNRAAFRAIQPFFAKDPESQPSPESPPNEPTMNEAEIKALQDENANLKTQIAEMQKSLDALTLQAKCAAENEAKTLVAKAASEGRIPPGEEVQKKWTAAIVADPTAKDLLLAMAPTPALVSGKVTDSTKAPGTATETPALLLAKYHALPRAEQPAFYAKHAADLKTARDQAIR